MTKEAATLKNETDQIRAEHGPRLNAAATQSTYEPSVGVKETKFYGANPDQVDAIYDQIQENSPNALDGGRSLSCRSKSANRMK